MPSFFLPDLSRLEKDLGYVFKNKQLLELALTHPSITKDSETPNRHYQRLEFLGDAVLHLIFASTLYGLYPDEREGSLARYRAMLARSTTLSEFAEKINLSAFIRVTATEEKAGTHKRPAVMEDVFEAIIGAIYLDSSYEQTHSVLLNLYGDIKAYIAKFLPDDNPKGQLQEFIQHNYPSLEAAYTILECEGPAHNKKYKIAVSLDSKELGTGCGLNKKAAEQEAAAEALKNLQQNPIG